MVKKYYAVRVGRTPGVYTTWGECQEQTKGYRGAIFRAFKNESEANEFVEREFVSFNNESNNNGIHIYIDGSYNIDTKESGYGVVIVKDNELIAEIKGSIEDKLGQRNILGEICAAIVAINRSKSNKYEEITINYDYKGVEQYAKGDWACRNHILQEYKSIYDKALKDGLKINFRYCKAHSGIKWNEMADKLAKIGCGIR